MARAVRAALPVGLLAATLLGCGPGTTTSVEEPQAPEAIADQEDEVCGMLVREQSAPRGQVIHRDGSRVFFCSLGDMLVHLDAPSPRGRAEAVFVEVLEPEQDPLKAHTGPHAWLPADDAVYVIGIDRPGIMGAPVLAYADIASAELAARLQVGARTLDLPGLRAWWTRLQAAD